MATISLTVPDALAARIVAMMRDRFASILTPDMTDGQVFKRVLRHWISSSLADYESAAAAEAFDVDAVIAQRQAARQAAWDTAKGDADSGVT